MKKILVTGGAGYIGSACVQDLCEKGHMVTVVDNLSRGKKEYVHSRAQFVQADVLDRIAIDHIMKLNQFDLVMHFAAHKDVGASMQNAVLYSQNIQGIISILDGMVNSKTSKIIFSSSAAVYGVPNTLPFIENHSTVPVNYYGETKLICENLIRWYSQVHGLGYIMFRYFNAVGDIGNEYEDPDPSNLFPIIQEVMSGKQLHLRIYGNDYDTHDGTCIRDYVDIRDLVKAHTSAVGYTSNDIFNLGSDSGYSVLEVVKTFESIFEKNIPHEFVDCRAGDLPELRASFSKAKKKLGWRPRFGLEDMVKTSIPAHIVY